MSWDICNFLWWGCVNSNITHWVSHKFYVVSMNFSLFCLHEFRYAKFICVFRLQKSSWTDRAFLIHISRWLYYEKSCNFDVMGWPVTWSFSSEGWIRSLSKTTKLILLDSLLQEVCINSAMMGRSPFLGWVSVLVSHKHLYSGLKRAH